MKRPDAVRLRAQRARARLGVALEDRAITPATRQRYAAGVHRVIHLLVQKPKALDLALAEWIEDRYADGEGVTAIADTLSGLHHFSPNLRGKLQKSWRLFQLWRRLERPSQAPPFPESFVEALVARSLEVRDFSFAICLALGFWGMLRTGEILSLTPSQLMLGRKDLVVQLGYTKTGLRRRQDENVVITHRATVVLAEVFLEERRADHTTHEAIYTRGALAFRKQFQQAMAFFHFGKTFRPYSLRRGGATAHFRRCGLMESTLIKGRWATNQAARQYIQEGLSVLTKLSVSASTAQLLRWYSPQFLA